MKRSTLLPMVVVAVAIASYVGFAPLFELTDSQIGKQFLSAAFGAIFIAIITLFLMDQQSLNEEKREKETTIFQEKLVAFKEFNETLQGVISRVHSGKEDITEKDIENIIFRVCNIQMHCTIKTAHKISKEISELFFTKNQEMKKELDAPEIVKALFEIGNIFNEELFPKTSHGLTASRNELKSKEIDLDEEIDQTFQQMLRSIHSEGMDSPDQPDLDEQPSAGEVIYFANTKYYSWEDMKKHNFWQGGQTKKIVNMAKKVKKDDVICAYLSGYGYLGMGVVIKDPVRGSEWLSNLSDKEKRDLNAETTDNINIGAKPEAEAEDYIIGVKWYDSRKEKIEDAYKQKGLFASPMTLCRLRHEPTIEKLKTEFPPT